MREEVVKKIKFDSGEFWCDNKGSYYVVKINHWYHTIEFESLGGASPDWNAFKNFCLSDKDMVKEVKWALKEYRRKYPIFIKDREGMSGCYDISLYVSKAYHEWAEEIGAKKVLNLHISCADKLNEGIPDMFVGDLLEILYYMNNNIICNLGKEKRHCYKYVRLKRNSQMERVNSICGSR